MLLELLAGKKSGLRFVGKIDLNQDSTSQERSDGGVKTTEPGELFRSNSELYFKVLSQSMKFSFNKGNYAM